MKPIEIIGKFDDFLNQRKLRLDAVVIGGTAMALLGVSTRQTRDCDVLYPELSDEILAASNEFAMSLRNQGEPLQDDWLNNGPASLGPLLPTGWMERLRLVYDGKAITLKALGRDDFLKSKLFGLCDRGSDLNDCLSLKPTADELKSALPWLKEQDANPDWPAHVKKVIRDLAERLGYEL